MYLYLYLYLLRSWVQPGQGTLSCATAAADGKPQQNLWYLAAWATPGHIQRTMAAPMSRMFTVDAAHKALVVGGVGNVSRSRLPRRQLRPPCSRMMR
jgi:hypothetical protein